MINECECNRTTGIGSIQRTKITVDEVDEEPSHPTENKYPNQTKEFRKIIDQMYKIHLEKNRDYSPSNIVLTGEIGVLIRIWDKFCRLCNLYGIEFPAVYPKIQSLIDRIESEKGDISKDKLLYELRQLQKDAVFNFERIDKKQPANEPVEDAWVDMANYSVIGLLSKKGLWGR